MGALAAAYDPATIRRDLLLGIGRNVLLMAGACWIYIAAGRRAATNAAKGVPAAVPVESVQG